MVQWLGLFTFTAEGPGSIPGWETQILKAVWCDQKKKKKRDRERKKYKKGGIKVCTL